MTAQRQVSLLFGSVGIAVALFNIVAAVLVHGMAFSLVVSHVSVWLTATLGMVVFMVSALFPRVEQPMHVVVLSALASVCILDSYNHFYGLAFLALALIFSFRYGYFARRPVVRISVVAAVVLAMVEYSAIKDGRASVGLLILIFYVFFLASLIIIYREEVRDILSQYTQRESELVDRHEREIAALEGVIDETNQRLCTLRREMLHLTGRPAPFPIDSFGLTDKERKVLEVLVTTGDSNMGVAKSLSIAEKTVKNHLGRIYLKTGIRERGELIELCKGNFSRGDLGGPSIVAHRTFPDSRESSDPNER